MKVSKIRPSILNAPLHLLREYLDQFVKAGIDTIHLDVMDGHFVPKISFGDAILDLIKDLSPLKVESHLMVSNPSDQIQYYTESDTIIFHIEAHSMPHRLISKIQETSRAGVAINPGNRNMLSDTILKAVDQVCIMTVNPGFGGQKMIMDAVEDAKLIKQRAADIGTELEILVDGGVNDATMAEVSFCDAYVVGSFLYKKELSTVLLDLANSIS